MPINTRPGVPKSGDFGDVSPTLLLLFSPAVDLYQSWVAPTLQSDFLVQFWIHSGGILPSNCSLGWKVLDVTQLSPGGVFTYNNSKDHSKWAVSPQSVAAGGGGGGWICVADINRNQAEEKRGGGALCQRDVAVWKAYRGAALEFQPCQAGAQPAAALRRIHV